MLAGAFAGWYWTFKKPDNLPSNGLSSSLYRAVRYHLGQFKHKQISKSKISMPPGPGQICKCGNFDETNLVFPGTVAFGSLIIAILRMVRVMLEKVEEKLAKYHQDNKIVKAAMCVCKCCFWCLEKFMKFLNRNAYIMCAVSGNNFCTSAKASVTYYLVVHRAVVPMQDAFFLLLRNCARLAVLTGVVSFLMFLSKIVVVGLCAALSYIVFSGTLQVIH